MIHRSSPDMATTLRPFIESALRWRPSDDGKGQNMLTFHETAVLITARLVAAIPSAAQTAPSKFSAGVSVEVRNQNDAIDEIVIRRGDVHIEQMSADGWFMGVDASDGSYWQFWFGSKNRKSAVEFRHTETVSAIEQAETIAALPPVSWTNEDQLGFLKDPTYAQVPMAMWASRADLSPIPLYAALPSGSQAATQTPPLDREQIAAVLYMTRYPNKIWRAASGMETAVAYEQADAMMALCSVSSTECNCLPWPDKCPYCGGDAPVSSTTRATPIDHSDEECPNFPGCHCVDYCIDGWKHPSPEDDAQSLHQSEGQS
jgi:hypothetical protein